MTNTNITFEQPLAESKFRYHGIRVLSATAAKVGDILSNSWHPASDCDWVDVDTELDGTCCFEIQGGNVESAIGYVASYWPGEQILALAIIYLTDHESSGILDS